MIQYTYESKIGINDAEVAYAEEHELDFAADTILIIEACRKKERKVLTNLHIPEVQIEIKNMKAKYPNKRVIWIEQFKKSMKKTTGQIEVAIKCSTFNGSEVACLYESDPQQSLDSLILELPKMIELSNGYERFFVIEIESEQIREKVHTLIESGIKNFIFMSGAYNDSDLWYDILTKVRISGGEAIAVILKRMHSTTKKSYMERAIVNGATLVIHGALYGGGKKKENRVNLFLDSNDLVYKNVADLPKNSSIYSINFNKKLIEVENNLDSQYQISRLAALKEGQTFCDTHKLVVIV